MPFEHLTFAPRTAPGHFVDYLFGGDECPGESFVDALLGGADLTEWVACLESWEAPVFRLNNEVNLLEGKHALKAACYLYFYQRIRNQKDSFDQRFTKLISSTDTTDLRVFALLNFAAGAIEDDSSIPMLEAWSTYLDARSLGVQNDQPTISSEDFVVPIVVVPEGYNRNAKKALIRITDRPAEGNRPAAAYRRDAFLLSTYVDPTFEDPIVDAFIAARDKTNWKGKDLIWDVWVYKKLSGMFVPSNSLFGGSASGMAYVGFLKYMQREKSEATSGTVYESPVMPLCAVKKDGEGFYCEPVGHVKAKVNAIIEAKISGLQGFRKVTKLLLCDKAIPNENETNLTIAQSALQTAKDNHPHLVLCAEPIESPGAAKFREVLEEVYSDLDIQTRALTTQERVLEYCNRQGRDITEVSEEAIRFGDPEFKDELVKEIFDRFHKDSA